jgi:hypothetical protein
MKNTPVKKKPVSAEAIACMADRGKDVRDFSVTPARQENPFNA